MIVGTKRDMVMDSQNLAIANDCGFDYIGSLCVKIDIDFRLLPSTNVSGFYAKKLGNAYLVNFGHAHNEPCWACGEDNIENIDIFVKRKAGGVKK